MQGRAVASPNHSWLKYGCNRLCSILVVVVLLPQCGQVGFVDQKGQHSLKSSCCYSRFLSCCYADPTVVFPNSASPLGSLCTPLCQTKLTCAVLLQWTCDLRVSCKLRHACILGVQSTCAIFFQERCNLTSSF